MTMIQNNNSSVFTTSAHPRMSEKYTHVPTSIIIEDMAKLGWEVSMVKEVKARKDIGYQKHIVKFRNNEIKITGENNDVVFPEIVLVNSHNGSSSFKFMVGLFRLVCENGLIIMDQTFENISVYHRGYNFEHLRTNIQFIIEQLPLIVESMNKMCQRSLIQNEKEDFAKKALEIRFPNRSFNYDEILNPVRNEDKGDDIWSVFNVIQEKLIKGLMSYGVKGRVRKARPIKNIDQDLKINSELYKLALEYVD